MVLTWKTHPDHANKEIARICGASLPSTLVGGCRRICTNSTKYRSETRCQTPNHDGYKLVDADIEVSDLEMAGSNQTKGSVECIDNVWYLVRNKAVAEPTTEPVKVVEKRPVEEAGTGPMPWGHSSHCANAAYEKLAHRRRSWIHADHGRRRYSTRFRKSSGSPALAMSSRSSMHFPMLTRSWWA